ncbi:MAG TPA: AMP-binding protein, partial [Coleofasciculaceae cyanobacterium]
MTGLDANQNIASLLQGQAALQPDAVAIADPRHPPLTFAAFAQAVCHAAAALQQAGLQSGDVALVFQPMSAELYVLLLALFRLGSVAMFVDPAAGRSHLEQC